MAQPAEVVRWFGAMQAQEFVPAKWAIDGQVIGHWRHSLRAKDVTVDAALCRELTGAEAAAMDAATKRFGNYFGVEGRWIAAAGHRRAQRQSARPGA
jgi:hypothetical protein